MSALNNAFGLLLPTEAAAGGGYEVSRSIRLNAPDSAFLSRTPASAGNRKTWTWAGWVKRSTLGAAYKMIFSAGTVSTECSLRFTDSPADALEFYQYSGGGFNWRLATTQVFRDPSAWYHIVAVVDSTQATSSDRAKLYVNGVQVTAFGTASYPSSNYDSLVNSTTEHGIGRVSASQYFDGYLADVHFIDGQALTPASFGETNATTGQWVPKAYTGTYGTNGFQLKFADNSNNTATTLGKDTSGNSNNWTPNNLQAVTGGPTSVAAASGGLPIYNTTDTYGTTKGTGTRTDSNSSSIVLAIPMDGANNGTTFTDESATIKGSGSAKTITANSAITSTAQSKYYGSSAFLSSTAARVSASADFQFTGDFTIEFWAYKTAYARFATPFMLDPDVGTIVSINMGDNISGWLFQCGGTSYNASNTFVASTWTHLAMCRSGNTVHCFINGILQSTFTASGTLGSSSAQPYIGDYRGDTGYSFNGYIQDLRIYKGVAKYISNFDPPSTTQNTTVARGCDSLVDSPTSYGTDDGLGGSVRGNYATWNPLAKGTDVTLANGNLDMTSGSSAGTTTATGTIGVTSGKWYWEITCTGSDPRNGIGIAKQGVNLNSWLGSDALGWGYVWGGQKSNSGSQQSYGASFTANDVVGVAFDADAGTLTFYKNGVSQGQAYSGLTSGPYFPAIADDSGGGVAGGAANFGQRPFAYAAPSGFKALCDTNLPAPVVAKPNTVMDVATWSGDSAASRSITFSQSISPDLVWVKCRSNSAYHGIYDSVRGVNRVIFPNDTLAEINTPGNGYVSAFNSNGFTLTAGSLSSDDTNQSGRTYVGWAWDAGSSTVTNTSGTITSQVRANASAGFSVLTWTGQTAAGSIGHGLNAAPSLIICKARSNAQSWGVYHKDVGINNYLLLDSTGASTAYSGIWGSSAPTSSVFSVPGNVGLNNNNGWTYLGYCFAPVANYSAFGSYTGNGSSDGPFVFLGFRPAVVLVKMSSSTGNWTILDDKREGYNVDNDPLYPNTADVEGTTDLIDITSNGFKVRTTDATFNTNTGTYVYAAWASSPFAYSRAR